MQLFWCFILAVLLVSCAVSNRNEIYTQTISSWYWAHQAALVKAWGSPDQEERLPNDNKVFIYNKYAFRNYPMAAIISGFGAASTSANNKAIITPDPNNSPSNTTAFYIECKTLFEIDPQGIVVDIRSQGNDCTADESFYLANSNPNPKNPDAPSRIRIK